MSKLDDLLKGIDPCNTIDRENALLDRALNSYAFTHTTINSFVQFKKILGDFYWHVESIMLGVGDRFDPGDDFKQGLAMGVLDEIYGGRGSATAFRIAQSGAEGGLYGVLKKVGEASARKYTEKRIDIQVNRFINELREDFGQYEATVAEYINNYASILPPEATASRAIDIKMNFGKVLTNHPYLVKRMRELGRI